jgi:hypothetical protein
MKNTALDEIQRKLREFQQRASELTGPLSFADLFPPDFMNRYTKFGSIDDMVAASGHHVTSSEEFEQIPQAAWNEFVRANTSFADWEAMKAQAGQELAERRLDMDNL